MKTTILAGLVAVLAAGCAVDVDGTGQTTEAATEACTLPDFTAPNCFDFQEKCTPGWSCDAALRHLCTFPDGTEWEHSGYAATIAQHYVPAPLTDAPPHSARTFLCEVEYPSGRIIFGEPWSTGR